MQFYIGHDSREQLAYDAAVRSLWNVAGELAMPLCSERLRRQGLLTRIRHPSGAASGQMVDAISESVVSTDFAISRFLTPILCQTGWALFTDCDVLFLRSPREMLSEITPGYAVYVVKHEYLPSAGIKMDGMAQTHYARKNWSSVMLFNCSHPANNRLSLWDVNNRTGRDLHGFHWLHDDEVGQLDPKWNWLVNETPKPADVGIAHFTRGGPWLPGWKDAPHDELWTSNAILLHKKYAHVR